MFSSRVLSSTRPLKIEQLHTWPQSALVAPPPIVMCFYTVAATLSLKIRFRLSPRRHWKVCFHVSCYSSTLIICVKFKHLGWRRQAICRDQHQLQNLQLCCKHSLPTIKMPASYVEFKSVKDGSESFSGTEYLDQVTIAPGLVIPQQSIGVASTVSIFSVSISP